jgi:DNA-binding transcriptional ArsR family regulator
VLQPEWLAYADDEAHRSRKGKDGADRHDDDPIGLVRLVRGAEDEQSKGREHRGDGEPDGADCVGLDSIDGCGGETFRYPKEGDPMTDRHKAEDSAAQVSDPLLQSSHGEFLFRFGVFRSRKAPDRRAVALIYEYLYRQLSMMSQLTMTTRFAALADPTRLAILQRLAGGDLNVSDLARPFALSQPTITSHLNVLERAGLIERRKVAQSRFCKLKADAVSEVAECLNAIGQQWSARLDRLAIYSEAEIKKED